MGKISDYANVLKSKLTDLFVVYQRNDGELETKNATLEQLGDAICGEQVHSDLKTDNQTIIGSINELAKDKNVADEYDDTHTYNTGDVTIYDNTLYICNTNNTTGTFDPSKWTATTIDNVIGDLSQLTTTDKSSVVGAVNEIDNDIGTINTYITEQGNIQKATLPSGKLTIDDIQSWCNTASKGFYWGVCYITSSFSAGWAIVQIANKIVSPNNAEILLTMSDYIITSFTRNMTDWTTKSGTLS